MQERTHSFGYWLRRRRKALDLTQEALAQRVSCSGFSIRKIEADERRPSRRLAERLAASLAIPEAELRDFLDAARAVRATNRLPLDTHPVGSDARAAASGAPIDASLDSPADSAIGAIRDATPFVGRSSEFGVLSGLVARLAAGVGHTVLIEGEPGIGKSRLMREVARFAATRNVPTLATNCYEIERATPYQPVIDLVTRALDRVPDAALRSAGAGVARRTRRAGARDRRAGDGPAAVVERLSRGTPGAPAACGGPALRGGARRPSALT